MTERMFQERQKPWWMDTENGAEKIVEPEEESKELDYSDDSLFPTRGLIPEVDAVRDRKIQERREKLDVCSRCGNPIPISCIWCQV